MSASDNAVIEVSRLSAMCGIQVLLRRSFSDAKTWHILHHRDTGVYLMDRMLRQSSNRSIHIHTYGLCISMLAHIACIYHREWDRLGEDASAAYEAVVRKCPRNCTFAVCENPL